jgi:cyanophycinase
MYRFTVPLRALCLLLVLSWSAGLLAAPGQLLIVGGALSEETADIHRALLQAQPGELPKIAIVPLASSSPVQSADKFRRSLIRYGARAEQIMVLPLAVKDDRSTEYDERNWRANADKEALASILEQVGAFWFVGGDQMRIIKTLLPEADKPTPVLRAIREQLNRGAVIGGTSAGAAMMSHTMITAGDSYNALIKPSADRYAGTETQEQGQLHLHHGLGFFAPGIIDQHFDRKARLGRLVKAMHDSGESTGIGIDEDTGILVDLQQQQLTVLGSGSVTLLNTSSSHFEQRPFQARDVRLSLLAAGDRFDLHKWQASHLNGKPTVGNEYADEPPLQGAGPALANGRINHLLGYQLLDNAGADEIRRYTFTEQGGGFVYRFRQLGDSQGYWSADNGSVDRYSIIDLRFDIEPVKIRIGSEVTDIGHRQQARH